MGARTIPPVLKDKEGYIKIICDEMIPAVKKQGIAKFNDIFCEKVTSQLINQDKLV